MKHTKLLLLLALLSSLAGAGRVNAQTVSLADGLAPNGLSFNAGDVIEYVLSVKNAGDVNLVNIDVFFFTPGSPPAGSICCDDPEEIGGLFIGTIALLLPDETIVFDSLNNPALAYQVTQAPCGDTPDVLTAYSGTTYFAQGSAIMRCDSEAVENLVLPVEIPVCQIDGPDSVCKGQTGIQYCSANTAESYAWSIEGDAVIVGPADQQCVTVDAGESSGSFTLTLRVCNEAGVQDCCSECQKTVPVEPCFEGCTPGFWKNHTNCWVCFAATDTLGSVFTIPGGSTYNGLSGKTLLQALSFEGGSTVKAAAQILLRAAVSALLNSCDPDIDYPLSTAEVISQVNAVLAAKNRDQILALAATLDDFNNLGCPIDAQCNAIEP